MGALRRSLIVDVAAAPKCLSRTLHGSASKREGQPSDAAPSAPASNTRRSRSAAAFKQITSLQNRRAIPGGLARGTFPSGQMARRSPRPESTQTDGSGIVQNAANATVTRGSPPDGQMVRAPSKLRVTRNATIGSMRVGPNLRGRDGGPGGDQGPRRGGPNNRGDRGPKKREKTKSSGSAPQRTTIAEINPATTLSDGMVHHLLRLQRKEWDRVPYEPKYTPGSLAANELIYAGRELFKGESPPVKIWGPLEKEIGVVGMFGAEAHLKIRRVPDGDAEAFGHEMLGTEEPEAAQEGKKKLVDVQ